MDSICSKDLYNLLAISKEDGEILEWDNIKENQLRALYSDPNVTDRMIACLFNISLEKVRYKRKKYNLTSQRINIIRFLNDKDNEKVIKFNTSAKAKMCSFENLDSLAIALTHYFFRNGPVEDMHANGQLSENDMKTLNKYMVDRIATILHLAMEEQWFAIDVLMSFYRIFGTGWDKPNIDLSEVEDSFDLLLKGRNIYL